MECLEESLNKPTRTDHYLMQIAQEVRSVLHKWSPLDKFKLRFSTSRQKKSDTEKLQESKSAWFGFFSTINDKRS